MCSLVASNSLPLIDAKLTGHLPPFVTRGCYVLTCPPSWTRKKKIIAGKQAGVYLLHPWRHSETAAGGALGHGGWTMARGKGWHVPRPMSRRRQSGQVSRVGSWRRRFALDQAPLQAGDRMVWTQLPLTRNGGAVVEHIDKAPGQDNSCNTDPVPPPHQWFFMAKFSKGTRWLLNVRLLCTDSVWFTILHFFT